jgi:dipeptidase E
MSFRMQKIVAIGGGGLALRETLAIDREIVRLTERRRPRALFVPTASSDNADYCTAFRLIYGGRLKCQCDALLLLRDAPTHAATARRIREADLIYVGGGNTLKMMRRWRHLGVDRLLRQARKRGTVLSGVSAGANCWFEYGSSDSMKFYRPHDWTFIRVRGLGFLPATCCPHYHREAREASFAEMIGNHGGVGIALDDHTALAVVGDQYRVLVSKASGRAYKVERDGPTVRTQQLPPSRSLTTSSRLFENGAHTDAGGREHSGKPDRRSDETR